ncbi:MAG: hypothetical protein AB7P21_16865 [Lautropia sp.]
MTMRKAATIRLADRRDIAPIVRWSGSASPIALADPLTESALRDDLADADTNVLLVLDRDGIAALGVMHYGVEEASLVRLDVGRRTHSLEREVGACVALLRWYERSAVVAGIGVISLVVAAGNQPAHGLLLAHGYRDFIAIGSDGQPQATEVRFSRDLLTA